ncbi:MAG TPA: M14 family zinc carboxypeptidase, partial [Ardenticatenaceae bacterium]|nr:M14 family zinc carboxypeptidase [Ardenticatenaceae bacterium]
PGGTVRRLLLLVLLVATSLIPMPTAAEEPPRLAIVKWDDRAQLSAWAAQGWDIWEVGDGWARAALTSEQRRQAGKAVASVEAAAPTASAPYPACYRTVTEIEAELRAWVEAAPQFVELLSAGPSWETTRGEAGRQLWTARLTNSERPGPKPKLFVVGAHHARELVTPELALRFGAWLLDNYGSDGDATWIMDHTEVWLMPVANPDGHVMAERRYDWRKNTNDTYASCPLSASPDSFGVDLNCNYGYQWGGSGSSGDPCNVVYRGPEAFSEPETRAVADLIAAQRFDLLVTLHSFGNYVLYPWSYSGSVAPPEQPAFDALAARFSRWNGYQYGQTSRVLYEAAGETTDWAYGAYGILGFTFEIGEYREGAFWPSCEVAEEQIRENLPALIYAAKAAGAPRALPFGPVVESLDAPRSVFRPEPAHVDAVLRDDVGAGSQSVMSATLSLDDGRLVANLPPADGAWGSETELVSTTVTFAGLEPARHLIVARAADGDGAVGAPSAFLVTVNDARLAATVVDAGSGRPVADAVVRLTTSGGVAEARTDAAGRVVLEGHSGDATVTVLAEGYLSSTVLLALASDEVTTATLAVGAPQSLLYLPVVRASAGR